MDWIHKLFTWTNTGTAPSENLKTVGFEGSKRPPASVFNYFFSKTTSAITEIQDNVDILESNKIDKDGDKILSTNDFTNDYKSKLDEVDTNGLFSSEEKTELINKVNNPSYNWNDIEDKPILPNGEVVEVIAKDQIRIGDVVYTIETKSDSINGYEYSDDIYSDNNSTILNSYVYTTIFSPNGSLLVLGGLFTGNAKIYSVDGTTITYISDIYSDNEGTALNSYVFAATFSPDDSLLVLGGQFTGKAKAYSVNNNTITYISDIYNDNNNTVLNSNLNTATFSPDGSLLVLGGPGIAKVYSVSNNTITYISDIYNDNNNTALNGNLITATFSPDGNLLVLGGNFTTGKAKIYSVDGTNITYISDIYSDNEGTVLSSYVNTATFSPDGNTLVLGGQFAGIAKVYSVDGTNITYISDITMLDGKVNTATFSPDGNTLVLGGINSYNNRGQAKVYSVDGTNITYISNIYADNEGTVLDKEVLIVTFSLDGNTLVLGGGFTGKAKVYSLSNEFNSYLTTTTPWNYLSYSVGIAQSDMEVDQSGTVQVLEQRNGIINETYMNSYVDTQISNLVNSAPETLDTLGELATAFQENESVVNALDSAITNKADKTSLEALQSTVNGKQDKVTGTAGQFVIIGEDGNLTTTTVASAEGVSF